MSDALPLPPRPNLEQYKKQAKDLVKDRAEAAPDALLRIQRHHPRLADLPELDVQRASFKLSDAQLIIAREHAFESWAKFARHVQALHVAQSNQTTARIPVDGIELAAEVTGPKHATGLVLFAHASGTGRYNPRNLHLADTLHRGALCIVQAAALAFNHSAMTWFPRQTVHKIEIIDGARHLFEEKSALEKSASLARDWFCRYLTS